MTPPIVGSVAHFDGEYADDDDDEHAAASSRRRKQRLAEPRRLVCTACLKLWARATWAEKHFPACHPTGTAGIRHRVQRFDSVGDAQAFATSLRTAIRMGPPGRAAWLVDTLPIDHTICVPSAASSSPGLPWPRAAADGVPDAAHGPRLMDHLLAAGALARAAQTMTTTSTPLVVQELDDAGNVVGQLKEVTHLAGDSDTIAVIIISCALCVLQTPAVPPASAANVAGPK